MSPALTQLGMAVARTESAPITGTVALTPNDMRDLMVCEIVGGNAIVTLPRISLYMDVYGPVRFVFLNDGAFKVTFAAFSGDAATDGFFGGNPPALLAASVLSIIFQPGADRSTWFFFGT